MCPEPGLVSFVGEGDNQLFAISNALRHATFGALFLNKRPQKIRSQTNKARVSPKSISTHNV